MDAADPTQYVTGEQLCTLSKRLAKGLRDRAGVREGDVVFVCSPNTVRLFFFFLLLLLPLTSQPSQIYYPALYLGAVCAGAIFTGCNPAYGEFGKGAYISCSVRKGDDDDRPVQQN